MSEELLDAAIAALREETGDATDDPATLLRILGSLDTESRVDIDGDVDDATLSRILGTLESEVVLDEAVAALRETERREAIDALDDDQLTTIAVDLTAPTRRAPSAAPVRSSTSRLLLVAASLLVVFLVGAPTTWALSTGRLNAWLAQVGIVRSEQMTRGAASDPGAPPAPQARPPRRRAVTSPSSPTPTPEPALEETLAPALTPAPARPTTARRPVTTSRRGRASAPTPRPAPGPRTVAATEPAPPEPDSPETLAFSFAHDTHFHGGSAAASLRAWDAYLVRFPHGRYEPEARFNRALALARLGRLTASRDALRPFVEGRFGSYRRDEVSALVDALGRQLDARQ